MGLEGVKSADVHERVAVLFGGTGFIGSFFARHLLDKRAFTKIYLADIRSLDESDNKFRRDFLQDEGRITFVRLDVRQDINWRPEETHIDLVANFAAIHREPGHANAEYFDCNVSGARNVCNFAAEVECKTIVFTSSISPYGVSEKTKDESTLPVPVTAYGASKLVAEEIHREWVTRRKDNRLITVRPGVVFGPGEGGNVSRLIKAIKGRYFFYMSNKTTRKAGIYVKEVCEAICWLLDSTDGSDRHVLANLTMHPAPSIEQYVGAIQKQLGESRRIISIPRPILFGISYLIFAFTAVLGVQTAFDPVRLRKTIRSNDIRPSTLMLGDYLFQYDLDSAMRDWSLISPEDWK